MSNWSNPFFGVQHLRKDASTFATVSASSETSAALLCWFAGCGLSPKCATFSNAEAARDAGTLWINSQ